MTDTLFAHQKGNAPEAGYTEDGLRAFFAYRDMGVIAATHGRLRVQLVRAARNASEAKGGTGFHMHTADVHVVYMLRGWGQIRLRWRRYLGRGRRLRASAAGHRPQSL